MIYFLLEQFAMYKYYAEACFVIAVVGFVFYILGQLKHKW
jgi:hypothetical protein